MKDASAVAHGGGECGRFHGVEAAKVNRHGQGTHLVIGDFVRGEGVNEGADLVVGQRPAVPLALDELRNMHESILPARAFEMKTFS